MSIPTSASGPDRILPHAPDRSQSRTIRVGFVVHAMHVAGAETLVAETIRALRHSVSPVILCLDSIGPLGEELREEGVEVLALGRKPGVDLRVAWRLAREVRGRRLEVLHSHQYTPFFYSALAKILRAGSFRLILTEHGRHSPDIVSARRRWVNRLALAPLADAVNACSEFSARALVQLDGFSEHDVELIANGIALDRYAPAKDRESVLLDLDLPADQRYVAMIGRFHPVKDHATMLRAFKEVAESLPDVDLLLIGDGPLRGQLESMSRELAIAPRIRFLGVRRDVPRILSAVDVFALTSLSEAASLTLLEAMASSLPSVVTRVGGNPEIVRNGVEGLLVARGDHRGIAQAIVRLFDTPSEAAAMGRAARSRAESCYSLEQTIGAYHDLYWKLARSGRRR